MTFVNLRYSVSTSALVATRAGQYRNEFILAQTTSPVFSCSTFEDPLSRFIGIKKLEEDTRTIWKLTNRCGWFFSGGREVYYCRYFNFLTMKGTIIVDTFLRPHIILKYTVCCVLRVWAEREGNTICIATVHDVHNINMYHSSTSILVASLVCRFHQSLVSL